MNNAINITQFFTQENIGLFKDLIMSGLAVMLVTQTTKDLIDGLMAYLPFIKKIPSTSLYTLFLCIVQSIFFMFVFNPYVVTAGNIYLTVINACVLYMGCTKSFDFVFKNITIRKEKLPDTNNTEATTISANDIKISNNTNVDKVVSELTNIDKQNIQ